MKLQLKKTYYTQPTYEFNLPAWHTCPFAKDCKVKVDRYTWKFTKIWKVFSCYAAESERFPLARESRWKNYESILNNEEIIIPKKVKFVRIHASGDFFSQDYFDKWLKVCKDNPNVQFWTFTKAIQFWVNRINEIPKNFTLVASYWWYQDHLIEKYNLVNVKVFNDLNEFLESGLPLDNDDWLAMTAKFNFWLLNNKKRFNLSEEQILFLKTRRQFNFSFMNTNESKTKLELLKNKINNNILLTK